MSGSAQRHRSGGWGPVVRFFRRHHFGVVRAAALVLCAWVGLTAAAPAPDLQGTVIVLNKRADTASFIDLATRTIVATAPAGVGPHELVVTADGRTAIGMD